MQKEKLNKWAELLLDTGKRNNLINFKDTKSGTAEILLPDFYTVFEKVEKGGRLEVYDASIERDDEYRNKDEDKPRRLSRDEFLYKYRLKAGRNQTLIYSSSFNSITAVKNLDKKAKSAIEETGVNIAFAALGFMRWFESDESQYVMRAPLLLAPVKIENESAADPYYIKFEDDEIITNPAFAFKLKNDFGIELPDYDEDEGALNYFNKVAKLVKALDFTVLTECKLGTFCFQKINMYEDVTENAEKIVQNETVRALLGEPAEKSGEAGEPAESAKFDELCNVVDADSSQCEAIELAGRGESFVLQGPPGTGKSQTITNIIAKLLSCGKKVLFVSEKLAALNVVYGKLKAAGLEEFCLELHSHKANKKEVIAELCRTLRLDNTVVSARADKELEILRGEKKAIEDYCAELHAVREPIGKSFYDMCEEVSALRNAPDLEYVISDISLKGEEFLTEAEGLFKRFAGFAQTVGYDYRRNVWYGYAGTDTTYAAVAKIKERFTATEELCGELGELRDLIAKRYLTSAADGIKRAQAFASLFDLLDDCEFVTPRLLSVSAVQKADEAVKKMHTLANEIISLRAQLGEIFDEDIYKLDGKTVYKKLSREYSGFFKRLFGGEYRRIISELRLCKKDGKKPSYKKAVQYAELLNRHAARSEDFGMLESKTAELLGSGYNGVNTDFAKLETEIAALKAVIADGAEFGALSDYTAERLENEKPELAKITARYKRAFAEYSGAFEALAADFNADEFDLRTCSLGELQDKCRGCLENTQAIDEWRMFSELRRKLSALGLAEFTNIALDMQIPAAQFADVYKKAFFVQWLDYVMKNSPVLDELGRVRHDQAVKLFCEKDRISFGVNKAKIKAALSATRPGTEMVARGSALGILLHEGGKKRKQMSIRRLLGEIGELALTLKPCFLMSPLSVSTYLGADIKFDTVIFDEASQIFPQDAIGAIYRAKQLIVVGDGKQMPPTNFFNAVIESDEEDEDYGDVVDFESILDLCSTVFAQKRLKWHYRSRNESLIAFSNKNFYDGELVTFPSAGGKKQGYGVEFCFAGGTFDRKSKTNRAEAEKVADLVFEYAQKYPRRSLGVVAFGIAQQNLIERIIEKRRRDDPVREDFFRADKPEPFFVKNLETVQGDERDAIIFSVAYGRDAQGKLLLNFGPLNREGGERRLNVAVTRAKENVVLVSSMHATDIDLSRAGSEGARLLREYLDYAEFGEIALARSIKTNGFDMFDSEFEQEVCEFLRDNGFAADMQVGCSSFKIDIALRRPDSSDYALAIECDGASYHSSRSARDRDRLRQEVLERMGWKFYRIWSTDWFRNKKSEKERLLAAARAAVSDLQNAPSANGNAYIEPESFAEETVRARFEFPIYKTADVYQVRNRVKSVIALVREVMLDEAPLSEEWIIKRLAPLYGRNKVTSAVTAQFRRDMYGCEREGIVRKNGFLYFKDKPAPMLRVPEEGSAPREIKHIAAEELAEGLREILRRNVSAQKSGLYALIAKELGFSRVGESIRAHLDDALAYLGDEIEYDGETLSLR